MNFHIYTATGRGLYARFAGLIARLLEDAIAQQPTFRLQQVQQRAKEPASLHKKLEKADALESEDIGSVAKDLAGCRLVFYTNGDVARFQNSGILGDYLAVDWCRSKIHHPQPGAEAVDLFVSNNYVVRLSDELAARPEYAEFRDLWCEVQVQTILNHAWSEMAHDMLYKASVREGFGSALMENIETRMKKIMRDHLLPAGYEFQKVASDFERLSQGKALFDQDALSQLTACTDNNQRFDLLQRFKEYVLPSYDDLKAVQAEARAAVIAAIEQARQTQQRAIDTPFGQVAGHPIERVVSVACDILDYLRYLDPEATFDGLCKLYASAQGEEECKRLLESTARLAKHELEVWKQAGPAVQDMLIESICHMDAAERESSKPVVMKVLEEVLETEVTGSTSSYNAVTLHRGAATASDPLTRVRTRAIDLLKEFFRAAKTEKEQRSTLQALSMAMGTPSVGRASPELMATILRDTIAVVDFLIEVVPSLPYELLEHLEEQLLWQYRHKRSAPEEAPDSELSQLRQRIVARIFAFRDLINRDRKFVIYKTLVGYESVFPPAWENAEFDVQAEEDYRHARIAELVNAVNEGNAEEWLTLLNRCAETDSTDLATFPAFGRFLEALGREKPAVVLSYLDRLSDRLASFLPSLLSGLVAGGAEKAVDKIIRRWIAERHYVGQIIWYERFATTVDVEHLEGALQAAIELNDDFAVLKTTAAAIARHGDVEGGLLKRIFMPALQYLAVKGETRWINAPAPLAAKKSLLRELNATQAEVVLRNLVQAHEIGYRVDEALAQIAEVWPKQVIAFFGWRLEAEPEMDSGQRYEAIPFRFHELVNPLQKVAEDLVDAALGWYQTNPQLFSYRGGRVLANAFPAFTPEFEERLLGLARTGQREDLEFLIEVLNAYRGEPFIRNVCKAIVEATPRGDPLWNAVGVVLDATDVVRGEFGLVEAYQQKRAAIQPWLTDENERVQEFARQHLHVLEQEIAAEQRRSEQQLEARKRQYGIGEGSY